MITIDIKNYRVCIDTECSYAFKHQGGDPQPPYFILQNQYRLLLSTVFVANQRKFE